jgi:hypothetical protein
MADQCTKCGVAAEACRVVDRGSWIAYVSPDYVEICGNRTMANQVVRYCFGCIGSIFAVSIVVFAVFHLFSISFSWLWLAAVFVGAVSCNVVVRRLWFIVSHGAEFYRFYRSKKIVFVDGLGRSGSVDLVDCVVRDGTAVVFQYGGEGPVVVAMLKDVPFCAFKEFAAPLGFKLDERYLNDGFAGPP